jgi:S1-C subfamily serine protease
MKYLFITLISFFVALPAVFSQTDETWEDFGDRIGRQAERMAERIAWDAERNAARWEANAERLSRQFERQWNRKWNQQLDKQWNINRGKQNSQVFFSCPDGAFLGIESNEISKEKALKLGFSNPYGAYVAKVIGNTAAARAGLQPFDYIYGVNEQRTSDNQDLSDILEDFESGTEVTIHFIRKGQAMNANVTLGDYEEQDWENYDEERQAFLGVSPGENEDSDDMDGVTVEVVEKTTAQEMGLKDGDVITGMNGYPILDWEDLTTAIGNVKPGDQVEVVYRRNGSENSARHAIKAYTDVYPEEADDEEAYDGMIWNEEAEDEGMDDDDEDRGFLGIYADHVSEEKAKKLGFDNPYGSYVTAVLKNTAAENAGIQPLDYIYGIDEYRVGENQWLTGILKKYKPGDNGTVHFLRKGKKSSAKVTFGKQSDAQKTSRNDCEDPFFGITEEGTTSEGVRVNPVSGSTAADLGLQKGDVISAINGHKMVDWQDITIAIEMLNPGETIAVEYLREGKSMKGSKAIRSYAETKKCDNCDCGGNNVVIDDIRINPDFNFNFNRSQRKDDSGGQRTDVSKMTLTLDDASQTDVGNMTGKGLSASSANSLPVERLSVMPNQSKGMFKLEFNLPSSGSTLVRVFNSSGRVIYEYDLGNYSGTFSDDVDISQNGPGSYYLHVSQGGKSFTKKIVLTKS